jgi:hypothetical protein
MFLSDQLLFHDPQRCNSDSLACVDLVDSEDLGILRKVPESARSGAEVCSGSISSFGRMSVKEELRG